MINYFYLNTISFRTVAVNIREYDNVEVYF